MGSLRHREPTMNHANLYKAEQFDDLEQQKSAATLGMWTFIVTEVLFFGVLFLSFVVYRISYRQEFESALQEFNLWIGTINTAVLLGSSFFMALSVNFIERDMPQKATLSLFATWLLGLLFLAIKAYEYYDDIRQNIVPHIDVYSVSFSNIKSMCYLLYYVMTSIHALHVIIGLAIIAVVIFNTRKQKYSSLYYTPVELAGLYWHFVDVVWVFIYPALYLTGRYS